MVNTDKNPTGSSSSGFSFGKRERLLLAVAVALGLWACATALGPREEGVPRQGWWKERGPVVPHDSFPGDCSTCHAGDGWTDLVDEFTFDHEQETGVALVGMHDQAECLRCHNDRGPVALFAQRGCAGCHEDVHRGQLGSDCVACHSEDASRWKVRPEIAQHDSTRFPLVGTHAAVACWRCHSGAEVGDFVGASVECVDCHMDDLARALNPDHVAQGFTENCEDCHTPTTWSGAGFTHLTWPLTGAHRTADCNACHINNVFAGTPTDCVACHQDDYNGTTDPNHVLEGFSTDCELCHTTSTWEGALFDHTGIVDGCVDCHLDDYQGTTDPDHVADGFSLNCEDCHVTTTWDGAGFDHAGIVSGCVDCHLDDYQATTDPNHVADGYPTDCENCHVTTMWDGAIFDHTGIVDNCSDCHLNDYLATTDPNHQNAGFPTTCETCHTTRMWDGAVFDHDFPIDSGKHKNLDCNECHTIPTNYAVFSCIDCHEHRQSKMDDEHKNINGYSYDSPSCYQCHPDGKD